MQTGSSDTNELLLERRRRASCETQRQRRGLNAILNAILNGERTGSLSSRLVRQMRSCPRAHKARRAPSTKKTATTRSALTASEATRLLGISRAGDYEHVRRGGIASHTLRHRDVIACVTLEHLRDPITASSHGSVERVPSATSTRLRESAL